MHRSQRFLAVLRSFFHSSLLCTLSCHPSPPTILPFSLNPSCHLFLCLPLNLVVPKFIYNILLGILFSFILCIYPNQPSSLLPKIVNINILVYHLYLLSNNMPSGHLESPPISLEVWLLTFFLWGRNESFVLMVWGLPFNLQAIYFLLF